MRPHLFVLPILTLMAACGPSPADYPTGPASVQESITDCDRGGSRSTPLADADWLEIVEGSSSDVEARIAGCAFKGTFLETGEGFEIGRQSCTFPDSSPAITINVSGTAELLEGTVTLELSGDYATLDDYGYQVKCSYAAEIVGHQAEE